ncbi:hypothetical protein BBJ29_008013 [Phytophthora kernoviae]|uniref:sphingomyelin phosphodiesterase n=1 Tax=Phytophthora kernoviae TaxID=325452 RepID=A0A3F2RQ54_9STRA|nr:hypothetical protein BBJ29_008013 [Phytophthora kernoviae]RLN62103.1 hypothetical protein BBP00_00004974 [Phytophthora kernoviae]
MLQSVLPAPWLTTDADVGITRVSAPENKNEEWRYEISLRFPRTHTFWLVQRSYVDFQQFHSAIETVFQQALDARRIQLPKPSRLAWAQSARVTAADTLRRQLNSYLHKLLEIESVHSSDMFRDFVTPRPESDDTEVVQLENFGDKLDAFPRSLTRTSSTASTSTTISARDSVDGVMDLSMPFPWRVPPPTVVPSQCDEVVHFGGTIGLTAFGGLAVGLTKRSALSGSQKVAAVAAGVAGMALTGPLSAVFALSALGGGMGKYQLNKVSYLSLSKPLATDSEAGGTAFVVENAEQFSGPRRVARFGDGIHLYCRSVDKSVRVVAPPDSKRGHAMAVGVDSCKTTLRLVSPYGHTGPLRCGSLVFVQVVDGEWAGQLLGAQGDFITVTKYSPAVFQFGILNGGHTADSARDKLVAGMKNQGFIYETKVVSAGTSLLASKKAVDGGCFAMSKYPLSNCEEITFGSVASGDDRMADKGIVYFQVRVPIKGDSDAAQTAHVVGTHLQAWETAIAVATRKCQLKLMRKFVDSLNLPKEEAVIFAGDMNVNKHADGAMLPGGEYSSMLEVLGVHEPELHAKSPAFSFDPLTNALAIDGPSSSGITERLDYVMVDRNHRQPLTASTEIVQLKATRHWAPPRGASDEVLMDLSDHYPVVADFHF